MTTLIPDREPEYALWLRTAGRKPLCSLTWYISPITRMHEKGISDSEILAAADVDDLIVRFLDITSIWDINNSKKRTYLRNTVKHYREYLQSRQEGGT